MIYRHKYSLISSKSEEDLLDFAPSTWEPALEWIGDMSVIRMSEDELAEAQNLGVIEISDAQYKTLKQLWASRFKVTNGFR